MIGYVTLGTNDLSKAVAFYDSLLAEIGADNFYAASFRDLDGNKLNVFFRRPTEG